VGAALRGGLPRDPWEQLREGAILVSREFLDRIKKLTLRAVRGAGHRVERVNRTRTTLEQVRRAVEQVKDEPWAQFATRHGDCGRDMFLWLGRRYCGASLPELAAAAGALNASAASEAVRRLQRRLPKDRALVKQLTKARQILKMET
jgi:hypothetical protein